MERSPSFRPALGLAAVALLTGALIGPDEAVVSSARPLGPYIEVRLAGGSDVAVLLPATPACSRIARPEASVQWVGRGFPGRIEAGGEACEAAGILDLTLWRDRRPRPDVRMLPRKTARWTVIHRDGRRALLRGRFELAGLVGMAGGIDLVAVLADEEACAPILAATEGYLEYRASGREAFRLTVRNAKCPVLGFARPLPESAAP